MRGLKQIKCLQNFVNTNKNGREVTIGILGKEKLKFIKKTPPAKNDRTKLSILPPLNMI